MPRTAPAGSKGQRRPRASICPLGRGRARTLVLVHVRQRRGPELLDVARRSTLRARWRRWIAAQGRSANSIGERAFVSAGSDLVYEPAPGAIFAQPPRVLGEAHFARHGHAPLGVCLAGEQVEQLLLDVGRFPLPRLAHWAAITRPRRTRSPRSATHSGTRRPCSAMCASTCCR